MVDEPDTSRQRSWLADLAARVTEDELPVGPVLATVARHCVMRSAQPPADTPLPDGAYGEAVGWSDLGALPPENIVGPDLIGQVAEILTGVDERRRGGVHHTPRPIAEHLTAIVIDPTEPPGSVCDPAVGGAAFLLAVARRLIGAGLPAEDVLDRLTGVDIEPTAVAASQTALALLGAEHGTRSVPAGLIVADALTMDPKRFPGRSGPGFDLVIGNPPFGSQLRGSSRRGEAEHDAMKSRFGAAVGPYTDRASLFLLLALDLVGPGGRIQMIVPRSLLAARDAEPVRRAVTERGCLDAVWVDDEPGAFDAAVRVCSLSITRLAAGAEASERSPTTVAVGWAGPSAKAAVPGPTASAHGWGGLLAALGGAPEIDLSGPVLGELSSATAGFRQQYYGLAPFVHEGDGETGRPLVTVGLIEPAELLWGRRPCRFARQRWSSPVVDERALARDDPRLGAWLAARYRPKVLVASQTRIIEAVVDPEGSLVPSVPVISVEPGDPDDLWLVAAVLLSPVASAWMVGRRAGSGLSADTVRVSARSVLDLPLPTDRVCWEEAAGLVRRWHGDAHDRDLRRAFATAVTEAYQLSTSTADTLSVWWHQHFQRSDSA